MSGLSSGMAEGGGGGERVGATFLSTRQGSDSVTSVREKVKNRWKVASVTHMNEGGGGVWKTTGSFFWPVPPLLTGVRQEVTSGWRWRSSAPPAFTDNPRRDYSRHLIIIPTGTCVYMFAGSRPHTEADVTCITFRPVRMSLNS